MIDITPYQQKLEWLREYMCNRIDGSLFDSIMDIRIEAHMYSVEQIMRLYNQTGLVFYSSRPEMTSITRPPTFEEYCKAKQINK